MRVALLVTDHQRGGTPLRIARLARGLHAAGVEVHAGCLGPSGPITRQLRAAGIPTFTCDASGAGDVAALGRLARHMRRIRPDLVHATLFHANVAARLIGLWQRIPVIGSTATIEVERPWHRLVERATAGRDRAHIVNSAAVAEHVVRVFGLPSRRVRVIPPSLDPWPQRIESGAARARFGIAADEFVVAWVGRLDPVKRLDVLVRVAEILARVPVRFLLAGGGPEPTVGSSKEGALGQPVPSNVRWLGWQDDVGAVLSAADAFLFPSRTEGMPNAVLEALACGVPVVASDIPVLRELAGDVRGAAPSGWHGRDGREADGASVPQRGEPICLVQGDEPRAYAEALLALRDDPALRQMLGERGAAWARANLDPRATVAAVLAVYQQVLECSGRPPRRP